MRRLLALSSLFAVVLAAGLGCSSTESGADPLPSWNDTPARQAIIDFVTAVTDPAGDAYVEPAARIATFDNDGTLWVEAPIYTQLVFATDRIKALAPQHPEWRTTQPFQGVLEDDMKAVGATGMEGLMKLVLTSHAGMTAPEFDREAAEWLATAKHPRFDRLYADCLYQPMLEVLEYLRANEFKTYIVSGGGVAFMRPISDEAYGIPPEQVIGSRIVTKYEVIDGVPQLVRQPELGFIDDKEGKPVAIYEQIGRRPILAFGNSDGDMQMVEYTTHGDGLRLGLFVHHTDAEREYAYDRESHVGKLDKVLDRAEAEGWIIVDMKQDWKTVLKPLAR